MNQARDTPSEGDAGTAETHHWSEDFSPPSGEDGLGETALARFLRGFPLQAVPDRRGSRAEFLVLVLRIRNVVEKRDRVA